MDKIKFFYEVTQRICGALNLEDAVSLTFHYVKQFMPLDRIGIEIYDPQLGTFKNVVVVTHEGVMPIPTYPPLPREMRKRIENLEPVSKTYIVNKLADEDVAAYLTRNFGIDNSSCLSLSLVFDGRLLGHFWFRCDRPEAYTEEHAELMSILNIPVSIALSRSLCSQELKEMKSRLADKSCMHRDETAVNSSINIVGARLGLRNVIEHVHQVAPLESPVLIRGETGTGKELVAKIIHQLSPRAAGPFIKVNCGAIPDTLIDSELFGHERGAFTGALVRKLGKFERADRGTIFLDEIGELPLDAQIRLLRVLQEKEIERVGGSDTIKVDVRIIAATHRNLESMISETEFREDLYFRLNVFPIHIPPLRDRLSDVSALLHHFINKKAKEMKLAVIPRIAPSAIDRLMEYDWPGNVREFENAIERELIRSKGSPLEFIDLHPARKEQHEKTLFPLEGVSSKLDDVMREHIKRVLKSAGGRVHGKNGAAEILDIHPSTLRKRMKKLGISFGRNVGASEPEPG